MKKGLLLLGLQCALLLSVAAKYTYDRSTLPRQWLQTYPYDPNHWLRGRYVRFTVNGPHGRDVLAFYIPENVPDPSLRQPGEELWVEVSVPQKGPLRPVRLGVKKDGQITPLPLR